MDSILCLVLLQLAVARTNGSPFKVEQPKYLDAVEGGSITLPCVFTYPDTHKPQSITIYWRIGHFHGRCIFNLLKKYTSIEFQDRIKFLGSPLRENTGSIALHRLKVSDSSTYFCRVETFGEQNQRWQSIQGTTLAVRERSMVVTTVASTAAPVHVPVWQPALAGGCGLLLLCAGLIAGVWICMRKKKRSEDIKKEDPAPVPPVNEHQYSNLPQHREGAADIIQYYATNTPISQADGSDGIVYSVIQMEDRPNAVRKIVHSEQNSLYADVKV